MRLTPLEWEITYAPFSCTAPFFRRINWPCRSAERFPRRLQMTSAFRRSLLHRDLVKTGSELDRFVLGTVAAQALSQPVAVGLRPRIPRPLLLITDCV